MSSRDETAMRDPLSRRDVVQFMTLWPWPLTIHWYRDGLSLCQVWSLYFQPVRFYCLKYVVEFLARDLDLWPFDLMTEYSLMVEISWWTIFVPSLAILVSAVLVLSCGQTDTQDYRITHRQNHSGGWTLWRDYRRRQRWPWIRDRVASRQTVDAVSYAWWSFTT